MKKNILIKELDDKGFALLVKSAFIQVYTIENMWWIFLASISIVPIFIIFPLIANKAKKFVASLKTRDYLMIEKAAFYEVWPLEHFVVFLLCCITIIPVVFIFPYMVKKCNEYLNIKAE
ncbi:MAG: hypothetical protein LBD05_02250 [Mycoplasmataceae bacterium]|jgi:hypothetical protein|nr:hypothetical protein [Mycoplasmataceae bacterium]